MRTQDQKLRKRYAEGAAALRRQGIPVTKQALAAHLGMEYAAVRTFFNRNVAFRDSLGIEHRTQKKTEHYEEAAQNLRAGGVKPTHENLAGQLGVDRTSVTRFLQSHPEVRSEVVGRRTFPAELTVRRYDDNALRIVLDKVSHEKYRQLWEAGKLGFQYENQPKPEHYPSLRELEQK